MAVLDYRRVHNISTYMAGVREIYSPIGMKWIQPPSQHLGLHRFMGPLSSLRLRRFLWDRWCPWFLGTWRHLPKRVPAWRSENHLLHRHTLQIGFFGVSRGGARKTTGPHPRWLRYGLGITTGGVEYPLDQLDLAFFTQKSFETKPGWLKKDWSSRVYDMIFHVFAYVAMIITTTHYQQHPRCGLALLKPLDIGGFGWPQSSACCND